VKKLSEDARAEAEERAKFAEQVTTLYRSTLAKTDRGTGNDPDVRRVAFGLVALRQSLDHFLETHRQNPLRRTAAGAYEADDILTALTNGTAHPIRKYLESLWSAGDRHNRPPPAARERTIRSMLAGAVLAYEGTGTTRVAAAAAVSVGIRSAERSFRPGQLQKWIQRSDDASLFADQFAAGAALVSFCDSPTERILIVAREALHPLLALPE
jgi:hypothetical protein